MASYHDGTCEIGLWGSGLWFLVPIQRVFSGGWDAYILGDNFTSPGGLNDRGRPVCR